MKEQMMGIENYRTIWVVLPATDGTMSLNFFFPSEHHRKIRRSPAIFLIASEHLPERDVKKTPQVLGKMSRDVSHHPTTKGIFHSSPTDMAVKW